MDQEKVLLSKAKLRECLQREWKLNIGNTSLLHVIGIAATRNPAWLRWKYVKYMRLANYYNGLRKYYFMRKRNKLGNQLGFEISGLRIMPGLTLYHNGPIVIHGKAVLGENCKLHGDNCIGNDGTSDDCPVLGDNIDIGCGAKILGNVRIANNVIIGAGAVVVKDINEEGSVWVGIPAHKV